MADEAEGSRALNEAKSTLQKPIVGTPAELSRQLGLDVHEVLSAIEAAALSPTQNDSGDAVYELEPLISALVERKKVFSAAQDPNINRVIRDCVLASSDAIRSMIKEENKTAYQIKQMTESRFIEVLGQAGVSLGRLEAFMAQATRIIHQMDARLSNFEQLLKSMDVGTRGQATTDTVAAEAGRADGASEAKASESGTVSNASAADDSQRPYLSNSAHWRLFETYLCQVLSTSGNMSESSRAEWFSSVRQLIGMGSLEVRIEGGELIARVAPALMSHFAELVSKLPEAAEVLPYFEDYYDWVKDHLAAGYPAILLYIIMICHRGAQMSWLGFISTFVNEG